MVRILFLTTFVSLATACASNSMMAAPSPSWDQPTVWERGVDGVIASLDEDACSYLARGGDRPENELAVAFIPRRLLPPPQQWEQEDRPPRILIEDFRAIVEVPATKKEPAEAVAIVVPRHFSSDFYSIPRKLWNWLEPRPFVTDLHFAPEPSVLHDWLYAIGIDGDKADRAFADRVFRAAMAHEKVERGARDLAYWAVDIGGAKGHGNPAELRFFNPEAPGMVMRLDATLAQRAALRASTFCRSNR